MNSVPINADGVADVVVEDVEGTFDSGAAEEMLAQLTWTLRQVPRVKQVRLTVDERAVTLDDGVREVAVQSGLSFSPLGVSSSRDLFALVGGRLVRGDFENFSPTAGALGAGEVGVRGRGQPGRHPRRRGQLRRPVRGAGGPGEGRGPRHRAHRGQRPAASGL
ncbi:GerMN domain-containing protein [Nocardioides daphniae]|uniref:GerMN domain-containing protein n=1 Tax=Nocardioides daphniae TaxID=402297 RepID=A0A4V1CWN0_9ACTN|nr:hypothetical protein E2C04_12785 [Nocardioides daphniae]